MINCQGVWYMIVMFAFRELNCKIRVRKYVCSLYSPNTFGETASIQLPSCPVIEVEQKHPKTYLDAQERTKQENSVDQRQRLSNNIYVSFRCINSIKDSDTTKIKPPNFRVFHHETDVVSGNSAKRLGDVHPEIRGAGTARHGTG